MTSAAQASTGRISANRTDDDIKRQHGALGSVPQYQSKNDVGLGQRPPGRPPRTANEAGLHRIVQAMRAALRSRQNIHVTRKEIAHYAGVTPALITYYFPERANLIDAVTVPVVTAMVDAVQSSLSSAGDPREKLLRAIDVLIETYATDATVIDLFIATRASKPDTFPDLIGEMEAALVAFFDKWLQNHQTNVYDALYLQKATIGMCKIVARHDRAESTQDSSRDPCRLTRAEAICAMLLEPVALSFGQAPMSVDAPSSGA